MASVFLYHVVGDLTVGKPELVEFCEMETLESAIRAIGESTECGIPVWKRRSLGGVVESSEMRQQRFVGILNSLDIVAFLARSECLEDQEKALKTPVSEVVVRNNSLLRLVDPGTRLIDALEMMKQGVRRLLVPKSVVWKGMSKRFSVLYHGRWLKNIDTSSSNGNLTANINRPASSATSIRDKFCCLSREDVIRFLIGCLGALAPLPLSSISSLGIINPNYQSIEASLPAIEVTKQRPGDPSAVAVVEPTPDGQYTIIGEISASKLWKCDYLAVACALANLSAGQFVMGVEDNVTSRSLPDFSVDSAVGDGRVSNGSGSMRPKKFSSRSIGFSPTSTAHGINRSMYRGRSAPLTCKMTSSLAAVMAQMLSHRATHVWVTEDEIDDVLVGVVGYADILVAVTKQPAAFISANRSVEALATEIQN
ncbi:Cystathionine beta-synthase family protein isoform 1 [Tripterygium wilfordii]|uniref:Cystathionine beta-synthase family protein isoform 1 n=1 Tax=Tripterygium wilfordii TaxID=458696 RepID=A0A7J7DHW0_TRIWF|nr:CBS domain-containing protein CBSX6-like [Tripterygium wilfordii]KAF5745893.1 Cystathionine beta-synthase family protein isoform 1 [Tripterygium wilfordii]